MGFIELTATVKARAAIKNRRRKKLVAIILTVLSCFSPVACGEGELDTDVTATITKEKALFESAETTFSYSIDGKVSAATKELKEQDPNKQEDIFTGGYAYSTYPDYGGARAIGKDLVYVGSMGTKLSDVMLIRKTTWRPLFPQKEISDLIPSLDVLVGEYDSTRVTPPVGNKRNNWTEQDFAFTFASKAGENDLLITQNGDTIAFVSAGKTWEVENAALSVYFPGVQVELVSDKEELTIVILEAGVLERA